MQQQTKSATLTASSKQALNKPLKLTYFQPSPRYRCLNAFTEPLTRISARIGPSMPPSWNPIGYYMNHDVQIGIPYSIPVCEVRLFLGRNIGKDLLRNLGQ
jgi:hypothetical protein